MRTLLLALLLIPSVAAAQVTLGPTGVNRPPGAAKPPPDEPRRIRLTVTPAPLPDPPLEYRLLRDPVTLEPGNSVPFWYRAELIHAEVDANVTRAGREGGFDGAVEAVLDESLDTLTPRRVEELLGGDPEVWPLFDQMETAAGRAETRWDLGFESLTGVENVEFLLPEFQNARSLARLLAARSRVRLARGDVDGAVADVAVGVRLARDVADPPLIICDLIGGAVASILLDGPVTDLIDTPGSPNLSHALSVLPDPLVDTRRSLAYELDLPFRVAPWLRDAETLDWPADRWRRELVDLQRTIDGIDGRPDTAPGIGAQATLRLFAALPAARQFLIDGGMDADRVEAMPPGQVLAVREKRTIESFAQRYTAAAAPGGPAALAALNAVEDDFQRLALRERGTLPISAALLPSVPQAFTAAQRVQTKVHALRVIEAVRAHAADTGSLPASLDDITAVPVPVNAVSGEPFGYRLEGGTAVLEVIVQPENPPANVVYEIVLE